ncbi:MAG: HU family DNA-binding protein [Magnetococcales bacterium]|nr:HU family DNA-binding protein [Magnetococcales bacterium]MBF0439208.1 HU family DNA-binding protein [Magnetococcales bacterium]
MNKSELVDSVAAEAKLTKAQAAEAVDAVINAIQNTLKAGNQVSLVGFGSFMVSERAARTGRNPRTGAEINIPAAQLPKFKPGKGLKDAVSVVKPAPVAPPKPPVAAPAPVVKKESVEAVSDPKKVVKKKK